MHQVDEAGDHLDDLEQLHRRDEGVLELVDDALHLEQLEHAQQAHHTQRPQRRRVEGIRVARASLQEPQTRVEDLDREGGERVDHEPRACVIGRNHPTVDDPKRAREVGRVEVEAQVDAEADGHAELEPPHVALRVGAAASRAATERGERGDHVRQVWAARCSRFGIGSGRTSFRCGRAPPRTSRRSTRGQAGPTASWLACPGTRRPSDGEGPARPTCPRPRRWLRAALREASRSPTWAPPSRPTACAAPPVAMRRARARARPRGCRPSSRMSGCSRRAGRAR